MERDMLDVMVLDVMVYEYVDGEEHNADKVFGEIFLKQYFVYLDNGNGSAIKIILYIQRIYAIIKVEIGATAHKVVSL